MTALKSLQTHKCRPVLSGLQRRVAVASCFQSLQVKTLTTVTTPEKGNTSIEEQAYTMMPSYDSIEKPANAQMNAAAFRSAA
jgi:hypothetical protein